MKNRSRLAAGIVVLAVVLAVSFALLNRPKLRQASEAPSGNEGTLPARELASSSADTTEAPTTDAVVTQQDPPGCLTTGQAELLPYFTEVGNELQALSGYGELFADYRGIYRGTLDSLASQGDSAAMVVIGMRLWLDAAGRDPATATDYLTGDTESFRLLHGMTVGNTTTAAETLPPLDEAEAWIRKAAMHGRVMALQHLGYMAEYRKQSPVDLGWVSRDRFESMSSRERSSMHPSNLYIKVAYELRPGAAKLLGGVLSDLLPASEDQDRVAAAIAEDLRRERAALDLPAYAPIDAREQDFTGVFDRLCPSEYERVRAEDEQQ